MNHPIKYWIAFNYLYTMKYANIHRLEQYFRTHQPDIFKASTPVLNQFGFKKKFIQFVKEFDHRVIEPDLCWVKQPTHHILHWQDERYPDGLREIATPPPVLYVKGNVALLKQFQLAMVGSRNPTPIGRDLASSFSRELVNLGYVITSGLALGIDGESHRGALKTGQKAKTIAVLGCGLSRIYPASHQLLAQQILKADGTIISEFPLKMAPQKENFPRRNRIVSGLSAGVLIVEATLRSGSLITARFSLEQGREVFALPGSIYNPLSRGCHALIKNGATLVETAQEIADALSWQVPNLPSNIDDGRFLISSIKPTKEASSKLSEDDLKVLSCIGYSVTSRETILKRSALSMEIINMILSLLELRGYIRSVPGGYCVNNKH
jgi:DNA processing protein